MEPIYIFKILIIGDREVGRCTFLRKSKDVKFLDEDHIKTVGVGLYRMELTVEEGVVILWIWNVSNKETFKTLIVQYVNGSDGVLLMFDLTNSSTLDFLSKYPQLIREQAGEIPILLVRNKVDLEGARDVSKDQGTTFARHNNLTGYMEISAKTGEGCDGIFELLAEKVMRQMQLH